jgi:hypothetical protein
MSVLMVAALEADRSGGAKAHHVHMCGRGRRHVATWPT